MKVLLLLSQHYGAPAVVLFSYSSAKIKNIQLMAHGVPQIAFIFSP